MSSARVYARNLTANWIGHGANLVVMFFLSPFVIHSLGLTAYGLWSVLNILVGYMGVLDLGIRASTGRHVILYTGKGDHKGVDETIRTSLGFFSTIGIAFVIVGLILGWTFPTLFRDVPATYHALLLALLPIMAINMWVSMFRASLSCVLAAHDRFDLARGLDLVTLAVRTIGTVTALSLGYGITGLIVVTLVCNIVGLVGTYLLAHRLYPRLRVWPFVLLGSRLRELFGYGIPAAISTAAVKIIGQTDVLIAGLCVGLGGAAVYSAGATLLYYSHTFLGQIQVTFFPPVQRAVARGEMGSARWLFYRQLRLAAFCSLPMFVGFIMFGRQFLHLWLYDPQKFPAHAVDSAATVMAILAASKLLLVVRAGAGSLLSSMGHIRFMAGIAIAEASLNLSLSLSFVLLLNLGPAGIAAGTFVARLLTSCTLIPWYACRKANLSIRTLFVDIAGRVVITGGAFAGVCYLVQLMIPGETWAVFWIQVFSASACYILIATAILVTESDRRRVLAKLGLFRRDNVPKPPTPVPLTSDSAECDPTPTHVWEIRDEDPRNRVPQP
jgi:O-antigen/teichoic acid export membrane protein